jgi:hypothetical protein
MFYRGGAMLEMLKENHLELGYYAIIILFLTLLLLQINKPPKFIKLAR